MAEPVQAVGLMVWSAEDISTAAVASTLLASSQPNLADWLAGIVMRPLLPLGTSAPDEGWVRVEERLPAPRHGDTDAHGEVMVWGQKLGAAVMEWADVSADAKMKVVTHWRRLPPGPGGER